MIPSTKLRIIYQCIWPSILLLLPACTSLGPHSLDHEKARLYLRMATDQMNQRDFKNALDSTHKAIEQDPKYAAAYNHLALIYLETKRFEKSEQAFEKALELKPNYPEVHNNLGVLKNRQGKYDQAIDHLREALKNNQYATPENALTNMGFAYYKKGDLLRAKSLHQQALDIMPEFCLACKNMGDTYAKERKFKKASQYYRKAVTHCPLFQESHYKLGLALMKLGKRTLAKTQLEKLIERHKSGPYVDRSNEVLKYLN